MRTARFGAGAFVAGVFGRALACAFGVAGRAAFALPFDLAAAAFGDARFGVARLAGAAAFEPLALAEVEGAFGADALAVGFPARR